MGEKCEHPWGELRRLAGSVRCKRDRCGVMLGGSEVFTSANAFIEHMGIVERVEDEDPTPRALFKADVLLRTWKQGVNLTLNNARACADIVIAYAEGGEGEEGRPRPSPDQAVRDAEKAILDNLLEEHPLRLPTGALFLLVRTWKDAREAACPGCECGQC